MVSPTYANFVEVLIPTKDVERVVHIYPNVQKVSKFNTLHLKTYLSEAISYT